MLEACRFHPVDHNGDFENDLYGDFTYIEAIVMGMERLLSNPSIEGLLSHKVYNIRNNNLKELMTFIETLEKALSKTLGEEFPFKKDFEPIKPGDVPAASTDLLQEAIGFKPETPMEDSLQQFADWYVSIMK